MTAKGRNLNRLRPFLSSIQHDFIEVTSFQVSLALFHEFTGSPASLPFRHETASKPPG